MHRTCPWQHPGSDACPCAEESQVDDDYDNDDGSDSCDGSSDGDFDIGRIKGNGGEG